MADGGRSISGDLSWLWNLPRPLREVGDGLRSQRFQAGTDQLDAWIKS